MKCVAEQMCQVRLDDGSIRTFDRGDVWDFKELPPNFRAIGGDSKTKAPPINFETAQENELLEAEYDLEALKDYIALKFNKKAGQRGKEKTVEFLLDCRYRDTGNLNLDRFI